MKKPHAEEIHELLQKSEELLDGQSELVRRNGGPKKLSAAAQRLGIGYALLAIARMMEAEAEKPPIRI